MCIAGASILESEGPFSVREQELVRAHSVLLPRPRRKGVTNYGEDRAQRGKHTGREERRGKQREGAEHESDEKKRCEEGYCKLRRGEGSSDRRQSIRATRRKGV